MLVEFRVKNFKSIRDEQVLSLVAGSDKSHEETHVVNTKAGKLRLLKSAVIYGANASGKSNLVDAFDYMCLWVLGGYRKPTKFRLDANSKNEPSEFEATYIENGIRYQYGFSLLEERVAEEWLLVYESDKPQEWFSRKFSSDTGEDVYKFSTYLKGQKKTWEKATRAESLFLTTAVMLNSDQLRLVDHLFATTFILNAGEIFFSEENIALLKNKEFKERVLSLLSGADLGIADISILVETARVLNMEKRVFEEENQNLRPVFSHRTNAGGREFFELYEESAGTRQLFNLSFHILEVVNEGGTLIVDELESSLHPLLLRFVVNLFNSAENKNGAQLIFTTHDAGLLDNKIFRRDQIWFTEKDDSHATVLYPLTDFSPRKNEALASGYLSGRYGAIPFLSDFKIGEARDSGDGA